MKFSVENIAGGNFKGFRIIDGKLSKAAIKHIDSIGYGGPVFNGEGAVTAYNLYIDYCSDKLDNG